MDQNLSGSRRFLFGAIMVAFVVVAVEILLQGYYYATVGGWLFRRVLYPIYAEDDVRCYKVKPDFTYVHRTNEFATHIYTNSQGLRTDAGHREYALEKPEDIYRILLLGPSFAFGWGVEYEKTYAHILEQEIRVPGRSVEVMNLGTPSQGAEHQLCWLSKIGHQYDPDFVVLTSYGTPVPTLPSDCPEVLECPIIEDGFLYSTNPTPSKRAIAFMKRFTTVFYGWYFYNVVIAEPQATNVGKELHAGTAEPVREGEYDALAATYIDYTRYVRQATSDDTPVAFIHIPYSFVAHPQDASRWRHMRDANAETARPRIETDIRALHERGIPIVHTMPEFIRRAPEERLFYWLDIHLTEAGNRVVADAAKPVLQAIIDNPASAATAAGRAVSSAR